MCCNFFIIFLLLIQPSNQSMQVPEAKTKHKGKVNRQLFFLPTLRQIDFDALGFFLMEKMKTMTNLGQRG